VGALNAAVARNQLRLKPHRFGKRNRRFDSPRRQSRGICPVAFILRERARHMVNRWCAAPADARRDVPGVNLTLNRIGLEQWD
jgi:hypothetical protein